MRLTKLEIYGFKSFARRTEIIFPQNVTGIVGPNGSGKSNISDAVRWVLGEQSAKNLRGNSMADVIFNGTEQKKPMNYCEVTLTFDNGDKQLPVDFGEVSITRRVYRSGDSEYLMNGAACRLKDIVELFRDTGVGKEGYSIIGQGRIDEILSQRSEDRRAVFEEAAGISRFRTRKEEAEARMKRADENLVRVNDILEELEQRIKPLKRQAETARMYLSLSEQLKELDVKLFLHRYDRLKEKDLAAEQNLLKARDILKEAEETLSAQQHRRTLGEAELEELGMALNQAHDELLGANDRLHVLRENAMTIHSRIESGRETVERLKGEMDTAADRLRLIEATMSQSDGGMSEAEALLQKAQEALDRRKAAQAAASEKAEALETELTEHKNQLMERMNRMQTMKTNQARQAAMQQQRKARREELAQQLDAEMEREKEVTTAAEAAAESLRQEESRLEELRGDATRLEESSRQLLQDILQKQKELQEDAQNYRAADTRLRTLRELQDGYEGYQYAVKNALSHAKKENMTGVRNVVAMLMRVPREYETALDMALGGSMQDIVTETEQDAKQLIEYLRRNKLGRATFLPMTTVRSRTLNQNERKVLSMDGCIGVASELVQYSQEYRNIMENLLGRIVIARDLDSGIAIMKAGNHAFRLVTLQGDVMHAGGSITGGSIQQKAQNLLGRDREIRELQASLKELAQRMEEGKTQLAAMEEKRAGEKEKREAAQEAQHQQEIAVVRDTEHLKSANRNLETHQQMVQQLEGAISQLDEILEETEAELHRMEELSSQQDGSMEEMNARSGELAVLLDKARREREAAQEALTDAMLTLQNAEHDCDRIRRDQQRLLGDSESCRKEIQRLENLRCKTLEDMKKAGEEQASAEASVESAEEQVTQARNQVEDLQLRQTEKQRLQRELQDDIDASQQQLNHERERLHRQELTQSRIRSDLSQLAERLWDTYELTYANAQELSERFPVREGPFKETEADEQARFIRDEIRLLGPVNVEAIDEYAATQERYSQLSDQRNDIEKAKQDLQTLIAQLLEQMETVFVSQFGLMQEYFSETFRRLFGGGNGDISLSNPEDPLNCGIEIIVQPPGKKRQLLSLFSGGERALTAIAILFAMLKLKPTPFCILDEIEAALDDANISYFADYLKEFSEDTQFVVVTHRKGTMERCDTLFGVAMEERGVSSLVSVNLMDYE
ncbi:MAG: chromosome segregation protein SMC [Clostridiales bacterium]|nr:chromosome segregation protein SMC [Clostridiales bacterium]